jgi:tetratricopeptide (TPR) repeat protein
LPVLLAFSRWKGKMGDFNPLEFLATGAIRKGHLRAVDSLDAKRRLAIKMGIKLFIAPALGCMPNCLSIEPGSTVNECINKIRDTFNTQGYSKLTPDIALIHIKVLKEEIHGGNINFDECEDRLKLYEDIFQANIASDKYYSVEGIILVNLIKGAMFNHRGNPSIGKKCNRKAAELAIKHKKNLLYIRASSSKIVSFADLCEFDEAEDEAENLLRYISRHPPENHEDRIRGERNACGAIGAQVYLQKALIAPSSGYRPKSKEFIVKSFELSKMLSKERIDRQDICRNAIQVFLWYAMIEPDKTETKYNEILKILQDYPEDNNVGFAYFNNHRFLGAYRLLMTMNKITPDFDKWNLPSVTVGADSWVRGLALKYRAALYAASGGYDKAIDDFDAALKVFEKLDSPLLRFFTGPLCLQAGESLSGYNINTSREYLHKAKNIFTSFKSWFPHAKELSVKQWFTRTDGLLNRKNKKFLPNPQIKYRY